MSTPTPEERHRMVQDVLRESKITKLFENETDEEKLIERFKVTISEVRLRMKAFVDQAGPAAFSNQQGLRDMLAEHLIVGFRKYDKEELLFLVCYLHLELIWEQIQ